REKRVDRCRVVDDSEQPVRKAKRFSKPGKRDDLELRQRRRGLPQHSIRIDRGSQKFRQNAGLRAGDREVGEERWMVPVCDAGDDLRFEIGDQLVVSASLLAWR